MSSVQKKFGIDLADEELFELLEKMREGSTNNILDHEGHAIQLTKERVDPIRHSSDNGCYWY